MTTFWRYAFVILFPFISAKLFFLSLRRCVNFLAATSGVCISLPVLLPEKCQRTSSLCSEDTNKSHTLLFKTHMPVVPVVRRSALTFCATTTMGPCPATALLRATVLLAILTAPYAAAKGIPTYAVGFSYRQGRLETLSFYPIIYVYGGEKGSGDFRKDCRNIFFYILFYTLQSSLKAVL